MYKAKMIGQQVASMIKERAFTYFSKDLKNTKDSLSLNVFKEGFVGVLNNDTTYFTVANASKFFKTRNEAIKEANNQKYKKENEEWLARNAQKEGMKTTASGLQYKVITEGKGAKPRADQEVTVKYEGHLIDGTEFDSSYKRNPQTTKFRCDQVIKGWTEALTLMPVGSKWEVYVPQELGYGSRAAGKIPAYSTLIFTVELIEITPDKKK
jgi:FKBP-type peptidyl-prolyl cis-trans isomerase FklB